MTPFEAHSLKPGAGWIELICGSMFSGKTEELIRRVRRAQIARQDVRVFKPRLDTRYQAERVNSHAGEQMDARLVETAHDIAQGVAPGTRVVAIDEIQFFDEAVVELAQALADSGKRVICTGLDQDFRGEPFAFMPRLMAVAEHVEKLQAICMVCGAPASRTQRLIDGRPAQYDDPIVLIGASERYEARCRRCHQVAGKCAPASLFDKWLNLV